VRTARSRYGEYRVWAMFLRLPSSTMNFVVVALSSGKLKLSLKIGFVKERPQIKQTYEPYFYRRPQILHPSLPKWFSQISARMKKSRGAKKLI
jgi:hypothetical protein